MNALELAQRLQTDTGMERGEAEAFAQLLDEYTHANTATKADVDLLRTELKAEIKLVRTELKAEIEGVRGDIRTAIGEMKAHTWQVCFTVCGMVGVIQTGLIYGLIARLVGGH